MKKILLLIFLFPFLLFAQGKKIYVWKPDVPQPKERIGLTTDYELNLVVFDGRTIPEKSKIEYTGDEVIKSLHDYILSAYPDANIELLPSSEYFKKSKENSVTIKIAIAAYHAGFGSSVNVGIGSVGGSFSYGIVAKGEWNGITSYFLQILDNRNDKEEKYTKEINEVVSKPNIWGYKTSKLCLSDSYNKANQALLFSIDNYLSN